MLHGICCDALNPWGRPAPKRLRYLSPDLIRLVARDADAFYGYHLALQSVGTQTAVVLARESFTSYSDSYSDYEHAALHYATHLWPDLWIIGNEPDGEGKSSWSMTPRQYRDLFLHVTEAINRAQDSARIIIAGQVSGDPAWLSTCGQLPADGIDIHPYGKDPEAAARLLRSYQDLYGLPIFCLEWNRPAEEIDDYCVMLQELTTGAAWYCWSDNMTPEFGLIDLDGRRKAEYRAVHQAWREK